MHWNREFPIHQQHDIIRCNGFENFQYTSQLDIIDAMDMRISNRKANRYNRFSGFENF
jgi:hypothetical protein